MSDNVPAPTIFQLTEELMGMKDWYSLGVALRVHPHELQEIQISSPQEGIQRWRIDLLQHWLDSTPDASWSMIITALEKIGRRTLSARLKLKYLQPIATTGVQDCSTSPATHQSSTTAVTASTDTVHAPPGPITAVTDNTPAATQVIAMAVAIDSEYYDIVVIGSTGLGKSALSEKLVQSKHFPKDVHSEDKVLEGQSSGIAAGKSMSCTRSEFSFNLKTNEKTKVRVLDTYGLNNPTFIDQGSTMNMRLLKLIISFARNRNLRVRRVVYFLPMRGVPEKAYGSVQEELKLMCRSFGKEVFNCMVIIATAHGRSQMQGFSELEIEQSRRVLRVCFDEAAKKVPEMSSITCPPVIYLSIKENEADAIKKIKDAKVIVDSILELHVPQDIPTYGTYEPVPNSGVTSRIQSRRQSNILSDCCTVL